jgi:hypothetical protein
MKSAGIYLEPPRQKTSNLTAWLQHGFVHIFSIRMTDLIVTALTPNSTIDLSLSSVKG